MSFVLDCSMTISWCFRDESTEQSVAVRDRLVDEIALAPKVLWDLEVWNVLLVAKRKGRIASIEANAEFLFALPVRRVAASMEPVAQLATVHGLSSYDALYLALALETGKPLATLDKRLARAAKGENVPVLGTDEG